ncbi:MAG: diacylglycerol kinase [Halobacteriovoraceae bacterium]|nr:diacylglycerol kinase [Halobacteriovoraceae bacterium]|tara:strand:- start:2448 stop:2939 length:492 start_codon:yes stop_codon:yes gene_type:complete
MNISLIAAMGKNRVIGKDNKMMWHLPLEFKHFKELTTGHCIVLGRKNYESIGRLLPNRTNIIVTRNKDYHVEGAIIVNSLEAAIDYAKTHDEKELFITGGGEIYRQALLKAKKIYLTEVDFDEPGDVYFPQIDETQYSIKKLKEEPASEKNPLAWKAYLLERR